MKEADKIEEFGRYLELSSDAGPRARSNYKNTVRAFYQAGYREISHGSLLEYTERAIREKGAGNAYRDLRILNRWCGFLMKPEACVTLGEASEKNVKRMPPDQLKQWEEIRHCAALIAAGRGKIVIRKAGGRTVRYTKETGKGAEGWKQPRSV